MIEFAHHFHITMKTNKAFNTAIPPTYSIFNF